VIADEELAANTTGAAGDPGRGRVHVAPVTIWEWVRDIGLSCGVDVTTHQLRHTSISRVVASRRGPRSVASVNEMGHLRGIA
jgi:integrase